MLVTNATVKLWTREEFYRLYESGFFGPNERVELIEGEIVVMAPIGPEHADSTSYGTMVLVDLYGSTHIVRVQAPLDLGRISEPQPDFALVARGAFPRGVMPTTADLVIEVSYSSQAYDRKEKLELYAKAGVPDYWVADLVKRQMEVYREPGPSTDNPTVFTYSRREIYTPEVSVQPLKVPGSACPLLEFFGTVS